MSASSSATSSSTSLFDILLDDDSADSAASNLSPNSFDVDTIIRPATETSPQQIELSTVKCTICGNRIRIEDIDKHSTQCFKPHKPQLPEKAPLKTQPTPMKIPREDSQLPAALERDYVKGANVMAIVDQPEIDKNTKEVYYRVCAKSKLAEYSNKPIMKVRRTFSDFQRLHRHLIRLYPYLLIPPLVDRKRILQNDKEPSFLAARARHCQRFLNRLGVHPDLNKTDILRVFLQAETQKQFSNYFDALDADEKEQSRRTPKWTLFSTPATDKREQNFMQTMKKFETEVQEAEKSFRALAAHAKSMVSKENDIVKSLKEFEHDLTKATKLTTFTNPISGVRTRPVVNALNDFADMQRNMLQVAGGVGEASSDGLYELLKDWVYYCKAAIEYAARFEKHRLLTHQSVDAVANQYAQDSEALIELKQRMEADKALLQKFYDYMHIEIQRFDDLKNSEMAMWPQYYAKKQIEAHTKMIEMWRKYID